MEIENTKTRGLRSTNAIEEEYKTPTKERIDDSRYLSLTDKCKVYTFAKEGTNYTEIAKRIGRNRGTIDKLLEKARTKKTLDNQHSGKGRYPKGELKLKDKHKTYILQWLEEGIYHSTNQIHIHLNRMANLKKMGYDSVNKYVYKLGRWIKSRIKTIISEKNLIKRREYCRAQRDVIVDQDVLFTDESRDLAHSIKGGDLKIGKNPHFYTPQ